MIYDNSSDVIVTRGLGKTYGAVAALTDLDLRVPQGSIFGFLGPNRAGKTTTIKLLLGLTRPTSGSASVVGRDVVGDGLRIRQRIGYLAQQPQFYDHMTARQTLRFTARLFFHGPAKLVERRVDEMLELVGLDSLADRPVRGFSGGERQRLGIAQAQINDPELFDPRRAGGGFGSVGASRRAGDYSPAARAHDDLLLNPHPRRRRAGQ